MYIVAIGWIYVALMMSITETNLVAGVATFLCYGVAPVSIVVYIMGTPGRRRRRQAREAAKQAAEQTAERAAAGQAGPTPVEEADGSGR
jgi:hypothetical protein